MGAAYSHHGTTRTLSAHSRTRNWAHFASVALSEEMLQLGALPKATLLEVAIMCGQAELARWLASLGCTASPSIGAASLAEWRSIWQRLLERPGASFPCDAAALETKQLEAVTAYHRHMRAAYHLPLLQSAGWWKRYPATPTIVARHIRIIDYIAEVAYAIPGCAEFGARHSSICEEGAGCLSAAAGPAAKPGWTDDDLESVALSLGGEPGEDTRSVDEKEEQSEEWAQAIELSMEEAVADENSDVSLAIMRSKADAPPYLNSDGVVVLCLTRHAQSAEVAIALEESGQLADARATVADAGCELKPQWAGGAWMLLPLTHEQFQEAGLRTGPRHIVALSRDEWAVRQALQQHIVREKRPKIRVETLDAEVFQGIPCQAEAEHTGASSVGVRGAHPWGEDVDIIVARTFVHFSQPAEDGASARHSAPW